MPLGTLIQARRKQAGLTQAELSRMVPGLSRSGINAIEQGSTKTISGELANELVKVLPVSMPELIRAMGFDLPAIRSTLDDELLSDLEVAPPEVLGAVRLVLDGWRIQQQVKRTQAAS